MRTKCGSAVSTIHVTPVHSRMFSAASRRDTVRNGSGRIWAVACPIRPMRGSLLAPHKWIPLPHSSASAATCRHVSPTELCQSANLHFHSSGNTPLRNDHRKPPPQRSRILEGGLRKTAWVWRGLRSIDQSNSNSGPIGRLLPPSRFAVH